MTDSVAPNLAAIQTALQTADVGYSTQQNDSGWKIEVSDPLDGEDLNDVLRVVDTQANVVAVAIPDVGLVIQTAKYEDSK